jgi:hypothetical protein
MNPNCEKQSKNGTGGLTMRLIDADAVDYENIMCSQEQLHWLNAIIEKQPTVEAVPVVHGRWEKRGKHDWCCTACKIGVPYSYTGHKYCHNCGADMRGNRE